MNTRSVPHRVPGWPLRQPRPLRQNRDLFVGWGALPYFSEFSPSGQLLFNAEFPAGVTTYRAYRPPWFPGGGFPHHR